MRDSRIPQLTPPAGTYTQTPMVQEPPDIGGSLTVL